MGGSTPQRTSPAGRLHPDPQHGYDQAAVQAFERAATTGAIVKRDDLFGGVTDARIEEYADDGRGVWKANKQTGAGRYHDGNCEVAAYQINRLLDMDIVPPTVFVNRYNGLGTSQQFMDGLAVGAELRATGQDKGTWRDIDPSDLEDMLVLDVLLGNADRHDANWGLDERGKLWAIDHGHSTFDPVLPPRKLDDGTLVINSSMGNRSNDAFYYVKIARKFTGHMPEQLRQAQSGEFYWEIAPAKRDQWRKLKRADFERALQGVGGRAKAAVAYANLQTVLEVGRLW